MRDDLFNELASHYDQQQLIEICLTAALSGVMARFHKTFLTDVDPETQEALAASCPLPLPPKPESS